ncbi:transposase [Hoeflea sp.]|uniref:transposase n=1 Tax=Hoeflea sp. TaxID=1940281 RepID=UPI003B028E26
MVGQLATIRGLGVDTADMLVGELFFRDIPDGGLTGSPDESGRKRREKGLARAGNPRIRNAMIQLAWRFLYHQRDSELARWYRNRTQDGRAEIRKTMIIALDRKPLIAL